MQTDPPDPAFPVNSSHLPAIRTPRRTAAFTLVEMMISMTLAGVLGGIIYLVSGEALASFSRNISINRSYTDARMTIDRIQQTVATAGHTPVLVDTNGALMPSVAAGATPAPAAGIRFYRANTQSSYKITTGSTGPSSSNKTLTVQLATGQAAPRAKDVLTVGTLGYQGVVSSVSGSGTSCTLTMVSTLASCCSPTPTATVDLTNPQQYVQDYTQVAYIVVGNQLRYYPQAKSVAVDTAAVFNNTANYQVVVNLVSTAFSSAGATVNPLLPFSLVNPPTVAVQLYAVNPDYTNRNTAAYNSINSADTYTYMQSSLGARSPVQVNGPY